MQLNDDHWICVTFKSQFIAFFEAKHINFYIWQACCSSGCHDWEKDCNSMVIIQLHRGHSLISMTLWHKVGHKVIVKVKVKVTEGYFSNKAGTLPNNYFVEIPFSTLIGNIMTVQSTSKIHYNITKNISPWSQMLANIGIDFVVFANASILRGHWLFSVDWQPYHGHLNFAAIKQLHVILALF